MKSLIIAALFFVALISSSCSTKIAGAYIGKAKLSGLIDKVIDGVKSGGSENWEKSEDGVLALVKDDGGTRTVEFKDSSAMNECELTEGVSGQTCKIRINGTPEILRIDYVNFQTAKSAGSGGVMISFQGVTSQSKTFLTMIFTGVPYKETIKH